MKWSPLASGLALAVLVACDGAPPPSASVIPAPEADYLDVAWLSDGSIVALAKEPGSGSSREELVLLENDVATPIDVDHGPGCGQGGIRTIFALPDGRIGFTVDCNVVDPPLTPTSVRAVDLAGGASEEIVRLPSGAAGGVTFDPTMSRGLYSESSLICAGIGAIEEGRVVPSNIEIDAGEARSVSEVLIDRPANCTDYVNAHRPAWSPDGATVAFFGSPDAIGSTGTDRLDAPWHLYLVSAGAGAAEAVLEDLDAPYPLAWSPDSAQIAFSSDHYDGGGTFIYRPNDDSVRKVSELVLRGVQWSPDGTQLAGIRSTAVLEPSQVVILSLDH